MGNKRFISRLQSGKRKLKAMEEKHPYIVELSGIFLGVIVIVVIISLCSFLPEYTFVSSPFGFM